MDHSLDVDALVSLAEEDPSHAADLVTLARLENHEALSEPAAVARLCDPNFVRRAHLNVISHELAGLATGDTKRLLVMVPPQTGKSTLSAVWAPFWWLARNPAHKVIIGSYGSNLAINRGRAIRKLVDKHGWRWGMKLEFGSRSVNEWQLDTGGGVKSVGVGSGVTGFPANCLSGETRVSTSAGEIRIDHLSRMEHPPLVLTYNHEHEHLEWSPINAAMTTPERNTIELRTSSGRVLRCTPDHRIHTPGHGYLPAADTQPGQDISTKPSGHDNVSVVRELRGESNRVYDLQVEGNSNFFAEGVLVHNCAIVDDPHKGRAEAESRIHRERVWDWWSGDFLTRLSPGAPVCLIMTPWHYQDLAHRVIDQDGTVDDGGLWRVVKMPAFAEVDDDPLGRTPGEPLPHPGITAGDTDATYAHWVGRRAQSTVRDWASLYQLNPQPAEGALVDEQLLRERRHSPPPASPVKTAVAVDPSGGGRDAAGIVGGFLADDGRLYLTHDATTNGPSTEWGVQVCLLAADIEAEFIVVESNFGGDMARTVVRLAWDRLRQERPGDARFAGLAPQVKTVRAKKGKLLRAEPVAQQITDDRMRFGAHLPEVAHEWATWQPTDPESPGRVDASVYLAFELLPVPGAEGLVSSPTGVTRSQVPRRGAGPRINRPGPRSR